MKNPSRIETLIMNRCEELGITLNDIVKRSYCNKSKGLRRLQQVFAGNFKSSRGLLEKLPLVLKLPDKIIQATVAQTQQDYQDEEEAAWRAAFKPHALFLTGKGGWPRHIGQAAFCGAGRYIHISFDNDTPPNSYLTVALEEFCKRKKDIDFFYYPAEQMVINWSPDHATYYSLSGEKLTDRPKAHRGGILWCSLK